MTVVILEALCSHYMRARAGKKEHLFLRLQPGIEPGYQRSDLRPVFPLDEQYVAV